MVGLGRRLKYDLIFTYKALSNTLYIDDDGNRIAPRFPALIDIDVDSLFSFNPFFNTRGRVCKLYKKRCAKATRQNFFVSCRMVNVRNSVPSVNCNCN